MYHKSMGEGKSTREVQGVVVETHPNQLCDVLVGENIIRAYVCGKMRKNKVRVLIGDLVDVELDPMGGQNTNRIIRRY